jgi:HEAT repeat protein
LERAAKDKDVEVAGRAQSLLRLILIRVQLTPDILKTLPGIEDRLAGGGDHAWTELLLEIGERVHGPRRYRALGTIDLEKVAARAVIGARTTDEKRELCGIIQDWHLGSPVLEIVKRLDDYLLADASAANIIRAGRAEAPEVMKLLADPDSHVRRQAATALGMMEAEGAAPEIAKLLTKDQASERLAALSALEALGVKESGPQISKLLLDPEALVRAQAVSVLARLGANDAVPGILLLLKDPHPDVRGNSAGALAALGVQDSIPEIEKLLGDASEEVRDSALVALRGLGAKSPRLFNLAFSRGVHFFKMAIAAGFKLSKPGAGMGPISHVSLFEKYSRVFYLPAAAELLVCAEAADLLREKAGSKDADEAEFARVCLEIVESKNRLRRDGVHHWTVPVRVDLVLYHYDPK